MSFFFFFKQKTAYEMRISDWSSDVCSSDLIQIIRLRTAAQYPVDRRISAERRSGGGGIGRLAVVDEEDAALFLHPLHAVRQAAIAPERRCDRGIGKAKRAAGGDRGEIGRAHV